MSAFIVNDYHINALLNYALNLHERIHVPRLQIEISGSISDEQLSAIGQILLDENYRSVNYRYAEKTKPHEFKFKRDYFTHRKPVEILKACNCIDYQSCETDDYYQSKAAKIIDTIRAYAISNLPGYDTAAWEIRDPRYK